MIPNIYKSFFNLSKGQALRLSSLSAFLTKHLTNKDSYFYLFLAAFLAEIVLLIIKLSSDIYTQFDLFDFSSHSALIYLSAALVFILSLPLISLSFEHLKHRKISREVFLLILIIFSFVFSYQKEDTIFILPDLMILLIYGQAFIFIPVHRQLKIFFESLKDRVPLKANRLEKNAELKMVDLDQLQAGDIIRIQPSEIIPVDGEIIAGATSVDESCFTNENSIFLRQQGQKVLAASLNRDSVIDVKMTKALEEQSLYQYLSHFSQSISETPKSFLSVFFAFSLLLLSILIFIFYPSVLESWLAILFFLAFIQIDDLLNQIHFLALLKSLRLGILIKSDKIFSQISHLKSIFFDKTGCITEGKFKYSQVLLEKGVNQGQFLEMLFSLESQSKHPLALGVETHPWYYEMPKHEVQNYKSEEGLGISGRVFPKGHKPLKVFVGNQRYLKRNGQFLSRSMRETVENLESRGETVVLCAWDRQAKGLISFSDTMKQDLSHFFHSLKKEGLTTIMLTGDQDNMISNLSYSHGLDHIYTRCLPEEKINKIEKAKERGELVAMVGNAHDSQKVYSRADISLVIDHARSLLKRNKGDVLIFGQSLKKLSHFISFSKSLSRHSFLIKINRMISFLVLVPLVHQSIVPLDLAVLYYAFSSGILTYLVSRSLSKLH